MSQSMTEHLDTRAATTPPGYLFRKSRSMKLAVKDDGEGEENTPPLLYMCFYLQIWFSCFCFWLTSYWLWLCSSTICDLPMFAYYGDIYHILYADSVVPDQLHIYAI